MMLRSYLADKLAGAIRNSRSAYNGTEACEGRASDGLGAHRIP